MNQILHFEQDDQGIVTLTMDYPPTRNALTGNSMVDAFLAAFQRIETEHTARVVIITAAGKVFTSGGSRSEEHTSGLKVTNAHLVCRLLLDTQKMTVHVAQPTPTAIS